MTSPTDPSDRPGGSGGSADDAATARLLRAALGGAGDEVDDDGDRPLPGGAAAPREVPAPLLRAIERRAARHHRRRQARVLGGAAAAAAAVVLVGGLVLPQLGSLGGAMTASSGSAGGGSDSGGSVEVQGGAASGGTDDAGPDSSQSQAESATPSTLSATGADAAAPPVGAASMLTAADVTAFSDVPVQEAAPFAETGQPLVLGACTDGGAGIVEPVALWRVDLLSDPTAQSDRDLPGLVERVARFADPGQAASAVEAVHADAASCTGPGAEGTGPTSELDTAAVTPDGGTAVVLASSAPRGGSALQVLVAANGVLVQLQITSGADSQQFALVDATDTVRTAVTRATGAAYSTAPAAAASGGG